MLVPVHIIIEVFFISGQDQNLNQSPVLAIPFSIIILWLLEILIMGSFSGMSMSVTLIAIFPPYGVEGMLDFGLDISSV